MTKIVYFRLAQLFSVLVFCGYTILIGVYADLIDSGSIAGGILVALIIQVIFSFFLRNKFKAIKKYIIFINLFLLFLGFHYFFSTNYLSYGDHFRFVSSFILLAAVLFLIPLVAVSVSSIHERYFHLFVVSGYYVLLFSALLGKTFYELGWFDAKHMVLYSEPSHLALVLFPFFCYYSILFRDSFRSSISIFFVLLLSIFIGSMVMLVCVVFVVFWLYHRKPLFVAFFATFIFLVALEIPYFQSRIEFSDASSNLSLLVFLSGWERAALNLLETYGLGVGFQQFGILGSMGDLYDAIKEVRSSDKGLNRLDGGTLGSKIAGELGVFGLLLLSVYTYFALKIIFRRTEYNSSKDLFFSCAFVGFGLEIFIRGMGYFSLNLVLFLVSVYWLFLFSRYHGSNSKRAL